MSRSNILKEMADHHYALADLFQRLAEESASASVSAARPAAGAVTPAPASYDSAEFDLPPEEAIVNTPPAQGGLVQCPKHHIPYSEGKFGPYCRSTSDDPAWRNAKGYCTITPKSAAAWLRQQAAVTA